MESPTDVVLGVGCNLSSVLVREKFLLPFFVYRENKLSFNFGCFFFLWPDQRFLYSQKNMVLGFSTKENQNAVKIKKREKEENNVDTRACAKTPDQKKKKGWGVCLCFE